MINLKDHALDIRSYIKMLEEWIINVLRHFGVKGERRCERVGVWVVQPESGTEEKIAAIGVRISRGITYHGFSLNVNPNLNHYAGIVPCGLSDSDYGITSLSKLGLEISLRDVVHTIVALSPFKKLSTAEK
jgi:lipoyl(octanoyl) transferase